MHMNPVIALGNRSPRQKNLSSECGSRAVG